MSYNVGAETPRGLEESEFDPSLPLLQQALRIVKEEADRRKAAGVVETVEPSEEIHVLQPQDDIDERVARLATDLSAKPLPGKLGYATFWNW